MTTTLPPLPEPTILDLAKEAGFSIDEGWLHVLNDRCSPQPELPNLLKFALLVGAQCAAAERERIRLGIDEMTAQCRKLRKEAEMKDDHAGARCMTNRCMELAMVYGLIGPEPKG